jgi:hypothetical protein
VYRDYASRVDRPLAKVFYFAKRSDESIASGVIGLNTPANKPDVLRFVVAVIVDAVDRQAVLPSIC